MWTDKKLMNRVIGETSTKEEAQEVVEWFSTTIEGQQHLADLLDKDAYLNESDPSIGKSFTSVQSDKLFRRIDREISNNIYKRKLLRVAAVVIPLLIVSLIALYINTQTSVFEGVKYTELYIPMGEDARIFFQDGTEVYLNSGTRIRYPDRFGLRKREVFLDGEAYFNVASNSKRPFIVNAQSTFIEVSGTSFNVNAYSDNEIIKVVLDKGKTAFHEQTNSYSMAPGQQLEYNRVTGKTTLFNLSKSSNASLWKNDILYFYDTPLEEVVKVLERKYNVHFQLQSPEALKYSYTLISKYSNLESVLAELQKIAPVKFEKKEDNVFVTM